MAPFSSPVQRGPHLQGFRRGDLGKGDAAGGAPQAAQARRSGSVLQRLVVHGGRDPAGQLRERRALALRADGRASVSRCPHLNNKVDLAHTHR